MLRPILPLCRSHLLRVDDRPDKVHQLGEICATDLCVNSHCLPTHTLPCVSFHVVAPRNDCLPLCFFWLFTETFVTPVVIFVNNSLLIGSSPSLERFSLHTTLANLIVEWSTLAKFPFSSNHLDIIHMNGRDLLRFSMNMESFPAWNVPFIPLASELLSVVSQSNPDGGCPSRLRANGTTGSLFFLQCLVC